MAFAVSPTRAVEAPPKPPKNPCPKCRRGTTAKQLRERQMCGPCAQIWYRPSYQQALDALSNETLQQIRTAYWEHGTLWRVVAALTKAKVPSLRKWDEGLVSMAITKADELGIRPAIAVRKPKPWNRKRRFAKR